MDDRPHYQDIVTKVTATKSLMGHVRRLILEDVVYQHATSSTNDMQRLMPYMRGLANDITLKVPNLVQRSVNWGVDSIVVGETPEITVTLPSETHNDPDARREHVRRLQDGLQELAYKIDQERGDALNREVADKAIGLGLGAYYYPLDPKRRPEPPFGKYKTGPKKGQPREGRTPEQREEMGMWQRRVERRLPWAVQAVHPYNLLYDLFNTPPRWVAVEVRTSDMAIQEDYPYLYPGMLRKGQVRVSGQATRTLTTYIDEDWYCVLVDGRPVLRDEDGAVNGVAENTRGFIWLKQAFGGLGTDDHENRPEYKIQGLIRLNRGTFDMKIVNTNIIQAIAAMYAFAPLMVKGPPDKRKEFIDNLEMGASAIVEADPEVTAELMDVAKVPGPVLQALQAADALLQTGVGPELQSGVPQPNEPASATRLRLSTSKAPWRTPKKNMEQALAAMFTDMCYEIKDNLGDLRFQGSKGPALIKAEDIVDGFSISVNLTPPSAEERAFGQQEAERDRDAGAITMDEYRHKMGLPDGKDINEQVLKEAIVRELVPSAAQAVAGVLPAMAQQMAQGLQAEQVEAGVKPQGVEAVPQAGPGAPMLGSDAEGAMMAERMMNAPAPRIAGR